MKEFTVEIEGMTCKHCAARVEKALIAIGAESAEVALEKNTAKVCGNEICDTSIISAIEHAGYTVASIKEK